MVSADTLLPRAPARPPLRVARKPRACRIPPELNFLAPIAVDDLVRIGRNHDGGYLIRQSTIDQIGFLLSFGISNDWSFERQLLRLDPGLRLHAYDHSVDVEVLRRKYLGALGKPYNLPRIFNYRRAFKSYSAFFTGAAHHFREKVGNTDSDPTEISIAEIFRRIDGNANIFLKMDIEGDEYQVIDEITARSDRIVGLVVEFHDASSRRSEFSRSIRALQQSFDIVHIHGNNYSRVGEDSLPDALEISFSRTVETAKLYRKTSLIDGLDQPNNKNKADFLLCFDIEESRP